MRNTSEIEWELARTPKFSGMYADISSANLKKLQDAYYTMFKDFHVFCTENNINYYMVAGTLIGAVRHRGFIPWDDDIDLVLFREDYDKLKEMIGKSSYSEAYQIIEPWKQDRISKVLRFESKKTTLNDVMGDPFGKKKLYIDILPIDFVSENRMKRGIISSLFRILDLSYSSVRCYKKYSPHLSYMAKFSNELKGNLFIRKIIGLPTMIIGPNNMMKIMQSILKLEKNSTLVTIANGVKGYNGEIVSFDTFYPPKNLLFEDECFMAPNKSHDYLTNRYGDYMKIPDQKEQLERHVRLLDNWKENVNGVSTQ